MDARRLIAWEALAQRRRLAALPAAARPLASPWGLALVLGIAGAAGLWALARARGDGDARTTWVLGAAAALAGIVMRAPYRMFWRADAPLLARLPIPGEALYLVATVRSLRAAGATALALALAAVPLVLDDAAAGLARLAPVVLGGALAGALGTPPIGTLAGTMVSDQRAGRGLGQVTGEGAAPPVIWLSLLPGLGGVAMALAGYGAAAWAVSGATGELGGIHVAWCGLAPGAALLAWPLGRRQAARALSNATREVAALDAVKLAHVELDRAKGLEGAWGALAGGGAARAMYEKDVALARRRYPLYFASAAIATLVLWGVAGFAGAATQSRWALWAAVLLSSYLVVLGGRLAHPPVERPRLVATLPLAPGAVLRGKWTLVSWRLVVILAAALPAALRAGDRTVLGVVAGAALGGAVLAALRARPTAPR